MTKQVIAIFDFDGTLTTKDTFIEFAKFNFGFIKCYIVFIIFSPLIMLMKLNVIPNWKTKQMIFSYFYKGMKYSKFKKAGVRFSNKIEGFIRKDILQELQTHQKNGTKIYVISASIEDWILPFCKKHNIDNIIATGAETDEKGLLTGKFKTMNCYGKEKLRRFQAHEPFRENYYLYVYGDSDGDNELFQYSDEAINVK